MHATCSHHCINLVCIACTVRPTSSDVPRKLTSCCCSPRWGLPTDEALALQIAAEVEDLVKAALAEAGTPGGSAVLALTDDKGKRILVQASKISYLEIGAADVRRVGFGIAPEASA